MSQSLLGVRLELISLQEGDHALDVVYYRGKTIESFKKQSGPFFAVLMQDLRDFDGFHIGHMHVFAFHTNLIDLFEILAASLDLSFEHLHELQDLFLALVRLLLEIDNKLLHVGLLLVNLLKLQQGILIIKLNRFCKEKFGNVFLHRLMREMHKVKEHLEIMHSIDSGGELKHALDNLKGTRDSGNVRRGCRDSHFKNLKLLFSNTSLEELLCLGGSAHGLVHQMVDYLQTHSTDSGVFISQRFEYHIHHFRVVI